mgnify:CR=1 FL=1
MFQVRIITTTTTTTTTTIIINLFYKPSARNAIWYKKIIKKYKSSIKREREQPKIKVRYKNFTFGE